MGNQPIQPSPGESSVYSEDKRGGEGEGSGEVHSAKGGNTKEKEEEEVP